MYLTLVIGKWPVLSFEQERPEVDVGNVDGGIIGGNRHFAGKCKPGAQIRGEGAKGSGFIIDSSGVLQEKVQRVTFKAERRLAFHSGCSVFSCSASAHCWSNSDTRKVTSAWQRGGVSGLGLKSVETVILH